MERVLNGSRWVNEVHYGSSYSCAAGPIYISGKKFPRRPYYGAIYYGERKMDKNKIEPRKEKMERIRKGSGLILTTSEIEYVTGTVMSEFPDGNLETIQALSLIVRENLRRGKRHGDDPICDTTHCQVYGMDHFSSQRFSRILSAVSKTFSESLPISLNWFPFFLGGSNQWHQSFSSSIIEGRLGVRNLTALEKKAGNIEIVQKGGGLHFFSCEDFRNRLHLLSCPSKIEMKGSDWVFSGTGEGHNLGMDLELADAMAGQGAKHGEILQRFYGKSPISE